MRQKNNSYADVVSGKGDSNPISVQKHKIKLKTNDLINIEDTTKVLLAKVRNVASMPHLYMLCNNEGFSNIMIKHARGLWVWIDFGSTGSCRSFQKNGMAKDVFKEIQHVTKNFVVDERMVWIELDDLPLCAWGSNAYKNCGPLRKINVL